jgi:isopenicillin-N epimerase
VSVAVPQPPAAIPGARLLFSLDPSTAHLNHCGFGAVPISVQRTQQRIRDEMEANPTRFFTSGLTDRVAHARRHLAGFLGADPEGTTLVGNTTTGSAIVLQSLRLGPGDEIVTTDHGYGAVNLAVRRECQRTGAVHRVLSVPLRATDEELVEIVRSGIHPGRTKLLIIDQLTSATARLFPTAAITAVARGHGVTTLVDAAHAPGMLPIEVADVAADFWVGNLHKWGFAPRGTAALVVAAPWRERVEPLVVSWEQESGFPGRVEWQATLDYSSWLAAPAGLYVLRTLGVDRVRAHNTALVAYGQRVVGEALGVPPGELPHPGGPHVAMRLIPLPSGTAATAEAIHALRTRIAERTATEVSVTAWGGRAWLRLCAQIYNTPAEYERLADRLPALLAQR